MELDYQAISRMLDETDKSSCVAVRRRTLAAAARLALQAKGHTPGSRARIRAFLAALQAEDDNDEIEVSGPEFSEVLLFALTMRIR